MAELIRNIIKTLAALMAQPAGSGRRVPAAAAVDAAPGDGVGGIAVQVPWSARPAGGRSGNALQCGASWRLSTMFAIVGVFLVFFVLGTSWISSMTGPGISRASGSPSDITFSLGASKAEVLAAQGAPTSASDTVWRYEESRVTFDDGRVSGWESESSHPLKVKMEPERRVKPKRDHVYVGATEEEVLALMGTPTALNGDVWRYGDSEVRFRNGKVVSWRTVDDRPVKPPQETPPS